jgi:acetyl esterase/lipase
MRNKLIVFILTVTAVVSVFTACKKDRNEGLDEEVHQNMSYGAAAQQKMDVYLPQGRNAETPVIVFLHGGGFVAGDKGEFSSQSQQLSAKGFVVLNVNYRLVDIDGVLSTPIVHKPSAVKIADQLADIRAAVTFALTQSEEWGIGTQKWAIAGHSAGATLAMLYAYGDQNQGQFKAVANLAGATTFAFNDESEVQLFDPRIIEVLYRAVGAEAKNANKLAYMAVSPFWLAYQGRAIATINIRPESNVVFEIPDGSDAEYQRFTDVLESKSVPNKWVEVAGADHGFSKPGNWDLVLNETAAFFNSKF